MKPRHKKPSIKKFFSISAEKLDHKHDHEHKHSKNVQPEDIKVNRIAIILDGKVYEILSAQDKLADIFLAQPLFVLIEDQKVFIGDTFKDGQFINE